MRPATTAWVPDYQVAEHLSSWQLVRWNRLAEGGLYRTTTLRTNVWVMPEETAVTVTV